MAPGRLCELRLDTRKSLRRKMDHLATTPAPRAMSSSASEKIQAKWQSARTSTVHTRTTENRRAAEEQLGLCSSTEVELSREASRLLRGRRQCRAQLRHTTVRGRCYTLDVRSRTYSTLVCTLAYASHRTDSLEAARLRRWQTFRGWHTSTTETATCCVQSLSERTFCDTAMTTAIKWSLTLQMPISTMPFCRSLLHDANSTRKPQHPTDETMASALGSPLLAAASHRPIQCDHERLHARRAPAAQSAVATEPC
jgi:hypothetical protein